MRVLIRLTAPSASFKVPEWRVFCHTEKLRNSPLRLKLLLSDSARVGHRFNGQRCACWVGHCRLRFRLSALHLGIPVTVRSRVRKKYVQQIETDLTLPLLEPPYPVKTPRIGANHGPHSTHGRADRRGTSPDSKGARLDPKAISLRTKS